jgi:hypothetical protein
MKIDYRKGPMAKSPRLAGILHDLTIGESFVTTDLDVQRMAASLSRASKKYGTRLKTKHLGDGYILVEAIRYNS